MNRKLFSLMAVAIMVSAALVCIVPQSEAKSLDSDYKCNVTDYYNILGYEHTYNAACVVGNLQSSEGKVFVYQNTNKTTVMSEIEKGTNPTNITGYRSDKTVEANKSMVVLGYTESYCSSDTVAITEGETPGLGAMTLWSNSTTHYCSVRMPANNGDNITVHVDMTKIDENVGVIIVTSLMMSKIKQQLNYNNRVSTTISNNSSEIIDYLTDAKDTVSFTSDKVTDYYLVFFNINDTDRGPWHMETNVNITGMAETTNPLPFALLLFAISIGVVAGIVYLAKRKIIE